MTGALAAATFSSAAPTGFQPTTGPPITRVLDDPEIQHGPVTFLHNGQPRLDGYLARPRKAGTYRGVLVVSGNRITEEYIPNTCASLAVAGFVGLAPDVFHMLPDASKHTDQDTLDDIQCGASFLRSQPYVSTDDFGIVGFCVGGRNALLFADRSREIAAVVAYHPGTVPITMLPRLAGPVMIHHGTADTSVSFEKSRALANQLRSRGVDVQLYPYEGAEHGFLAYTRPSYRPDDACLSWQRTVEFLDTRITKRGG